MNINFKTHKVGYGNPALACDPVPGCTLSTSLSPLIILIILSSFITILFFSILLSSQTMDESNSSEQPSDSV